MCSGLRSCGPPSIPVTRYESHVATKPCAANHAVAPGVYNVSVPHMSLLSGSREMKKGSAELLILSAIEARPRHGYDIAQRIEERSGGTITFHAASLYPLLYRLEQRGWISGRWTERSGERRRRMYRLT